MAENDKMQAELPVSGNPFTHDRFRIALQAAIMDEIIVDGGGTYQIRVPDKLISRLEALLSPHLDCQVEETAIQRLLEADRAARAEKRALVSIVLGPAGIQLAAQEPGGRYGLELVEWRRFYEARINVLLGIIPRVVDVALRKAGTLGG